MERHPKEFIDNWSDELRDAFRAAERNYEQPMHRGTPREVAVRKTLASFLPRKYGVTHGHVISSTPEWSRQSDVIIYNSLEAPIFSHDEGHQGTVVPAECVYSIAEIKSSLTTSEFRDAANKIAQFKRLCCASGTEWPKLSDRLGLVFAYQLGTKEQAKAEQFIEGWLDIARSYPPDEQIDSVLVLGADSTDLSTGFVIMRVPQGSPSGPLDFSVLHEGKRSAPIFFFHLYSELRKVRADAPTSSSALHYMLNLGQEPHADEVLGDPRRLRVLGRHDVRNAVSAELSKRARLGFTCPFCGCDEFGVYEDVYCIIATKDYFGRLGVPNIPLTVLECSNCYYLSMHGTNGLGITKNADFDVPRD